MWHYAVVVGWDAAGGNVILHSGTTPSRFVALGVFDRTWARSGYWGLLVLPPSRLPASATPSRYLRAVGALERMGRWPVAIRGYRTALERWPDSLAAAMGLGVCQYEHGDAADAEATFRAAVDKFPHDGTPYNNLAQLLADQGRLPEAVAAAQQAVERGGPLESSFQRTLDDIRGQIHPAPSHQGVPSF